MKVKTLISSIILTITILFNSCDNKDNNLIYCKDFKFQGEEYWFAEKVDELVLFEDPYAYEKAFKVTLKECKHITKYTSSNNCNCQDFSNMILANDSDTIHLKRKSQYINNEELETLSEIVFTFNNQQTIFSENDFVGFENISINLVQLDSCKVYQLNYNEEQSVRKVYLAKGIGIVRYIMQDGSMWTNNDLEFEGNNNLNSFDYNESICE